MKLEERNLKAEEYLRKKREQKMVYDDIAMLIITVLTIVMMLMFT